MLNQTTALPRHDPSLLRQASDVDGKWIEAATEVKYLALGGIGA